MTRRAARAVAAIVAVGTLTAVPAASPATPLRYDAATRLVAYERRTCDLAATALQGGSAGGTSNYRAAVDWEHVGVLARAIRKATGRAPALVARDDRGACTGPVPRLRAKKLRFDFAAALRGARERLCAAVYNENYEVDEARTAESARVYNDVAKAYRLAARDARRTVRIESSAAVRADCQA